MLCSADREESLRQISSSVLSRLQLPANASYSIDIACSAEVFQVKVCALIMCI